MPRFAFDLLRQLLLALACAILLPSGMIWADAVSPVGAAEISYQRDVLPILRAHCQGCHQPARTEGGVDLTSRDGLFGEGDSGVAVITPGEVDASELLAQITPDDSGAGAAGTADAGAAGAGADGSGADGTADAGGSGDAGAGADGSSAGADGGTNDPVDPPSGLDASGDSTAAGIRISAR